MKLIDADIIVSYQTYDDEHEEFPEHKSTIAEFLDTMTDEGCPEAVDAVPVRHGHWVDHNDDDDDDDWGMWECSECHVHLMSMAVNLNGVYRFCPKCGARMDGKDGGDG